MLYDTRYKYARAIGMTITRLFNGHGFEVYRLRQNTGEVDIVRHQVCCACGETYQTASLSQANKWRKTHCCSVKIGGKKVRRPYLCR